MDLTTDISDPTQWLETPLSLLAPLESALRCQVCKEFFDNPVMTSCCHTFCSLCIRRCLSAEGKCPACRSPDQELKLRRNWAVQELVDAFQTARPSVLDFTTKENTRLAQAEEQKDQPAQKKRKVSQVEEEAQVHETSSQARRTRSQRSRTELAEEDIAFRPAPEVIEDSQDDEDYTPEDGLVACPICNRKMKEEAVFPHLNVHQQEEEAPARTPTKPSSFGSLRAPQRGLATTGKPLERLPAINYSILKENALRKKLADLGIPNWGPKQLLHKRHTEWMNLWNANCDSKTPKSKRELLQELDIWEKTQGGLATGPSPFVSSSNVMRKDFDAKEWSSSHDDDFKLLIANARKRAGAKHKSAAPQSPAPSVPQAESGLVEPIIDIDGDNVVDLSG